MTTPVYSCPLERDYQNLATAAAVKIFDVLCRTWIDKKKTSVAFFVCRPPASIPKHFHLLYFYFINRTDFTKPHMRHHLVPTTNPAEPARSELSSAM
jgi:hypothetical protein